MPNLPTHPCLECGRLTSSRVRLCPDHKHTIATGQLLRPCTMGCGKRTKATGGVCPECQRLTDNAHLAELLEDADYGLGAGDWRFDPFRRVRVWVPKGGKTTPRRGDDEVAIRRRAQAMAERFADVGEEVA